MSSDDLRPRVTHLEDQIAGAQAEISRIEKLMAQERTRFTDRIATYQQQIDSLTPYAEDPAKRMTIDNYENEKMTAQSEFDRSQQKESASLAAAQRNLEQLQRDLQSAKSEYETTKKREEAMRLASLAAARANDPNHGSVSPAP